MAFRRVDPGAGSTTCLDLMFRLQTVDCDIEMMELVRERPFVHRAGDEIVSGVIDRLVLERNADGRIGTAEVLDFKSDRLDLQDGDAPADRADAYRPQVNAYQKRRIRRVRVRRATCGRSAGLSRSGDGPRCVTGGDLRGAAATPAAEPVEISQRFGC